MPRIQTEDPSRMEKVYAAKKKPVIVLKELCHIRGSILISIA
jgi:hypothetical protein